MWNLFDYSNFYLLADVLGRGGQRGPVAEPGGDRHPHRPGAAAVDGAAVPLPNLPAARPAGGRPQRPRRDRDHPAPALRPRPDAR